MKFHMILYIFCWQLITTKVEASRLTEICDFDAIIHIPSTSAPNVNRSQVLGIKGSLIASAGGGMYGVKQYEPGKETWGYVSVRPGAQMFWWLYYATNTTNYTSKPLVLWLQGGPGASSTGFGNFMEIGPLDVNQKPRNSSWVHHVNVLFVDNPVGTGFSYVKNSSLLARNNSAIASDLVEFMKAFLNKVPEFKYVPFYVFSESYGGKMAVQFARALYKQIESKKITLPFKGIALGDSWISPIDSVLTWSPFLLDTSVVDSEGALAIQKAANETRAAVEAGNFTEATKLWSEVEDVVTKYSHNVNFYNILYRTNPKSNLSGTYNEKLFSRHVRLPGEEDLAKLMNGPIKEKLRVIPVNVTWGGQSRLVFNALAEDFMKPVTDLVEVLLNSTELSVSVYNAQLDMIVDTAGTLQWVQKLKWPGTAKWMKAARNPIVIDGYTEGYTKRYKTFSFHWINRAGHMVPMDNPKTALKILQIITNAE